MKKAIREFLVNVWGFCGYWKCNGVCTLEHEHPHTARMRIFAAKIGCAVSKQILQYL